MLSFEGNEDVRSCDGLSRRDFLRVGTLSAGSIGLSLANLMGLQQAGAAARSGDMNCILLFLVGGPSQLDTWDLKPDAPDSIRGPFRPIKTNVSGMEICEHFPLMAQMADRYAIVRSVFHQEAPIHETGQQLMQTGRLCRAGQEYPHYGAVVSYLNGRKKAGLPASVVLPGPIGNTGVSISHGQEAGSLGSEHELFAVESDATDGLITVADRETIAGVDPARLHTPHALVDAVDAAHRDFDAGEENTKAPRSAEALDRLFASETKRAFDVAAETESLRRRYGMNTFGQSCLLARGLVEKGVRLVTVNMFDTVFNEITWDCHADGGALATTLDDYKQTLCPMFDRAYSALLDDLRQRGLLQNTMVVAMGEFGRTPKLNLRGGRDHWPSVWSILFAGGKVRGGQIIGSSDKHAMEPKDRPVHPSQVAASVYHGLGIDLDARLPGPENQRLSIVEAEPVGELF